MEYFDYNNPNKILKKAKELDTLLSKNGFPVFLNGGTLLGCIREGDLIKHDDDIDLFYMSNKTHRKAVLDEFDIAIKPILERNGWEIKPISWTWKSKPKLMMGQFHVIKDDISIDLWTGWLNDKDQLSVTMGLENSDISHNDLFPVKQKMLRGIKFNVPNNSEKHLSRLYGENWKTPDPSYKIPSNKNFLQKSILKVIDQFGWAYYFIAKEQQNHSYHDIEYRRIGDILNTKVSPDIVYFHSPGLGNENVTNIIKNNIDRKKTKIIGAYGGEHPESYIDADLIVTISFPYLNNLKEKYPNKSCIFLPEALDLDYFKPKKGRPSIKFDVGYVGRPCKVKRMHLLDKLDYNVKTHTEWGPQYFVDGRTLDNVKEFYKSIDCLVLTSQSECMPRVVLEAMAMGLPVISTDVGCMRMLLEPEWIVPNTSEEDIVKNINDRLNILKKYPSIRKAVGKRNRKHMEKHFNWEIAQQKWDDVFNALAIDDFETIEKIGKEFEDKWNHLYETYMKQNRQDLTQQILKNDEVLIPKKDVIKNKIEENYFYIVTELTRQRIKYCLKEHTCLDAINHGKFNNCLTTIYLGIERELKNKEEILARLPNPEIKIVFSRYCNKTKSWGKWYNQTCVPFPVVPYLKNLYGKTWREQ